MLIKCCSNGVNKDMNFIGWGSYLQAENWFQRLRAFLYKIPINGNNFEHHFVHQASMLSSYISRWYIYCFLSEYVATFVGYMGEKTLLWRHNGRDGVIITSLTIVYSTVYSGADQRKHQSSASLAFVWGIHQWPVNSPHKWPVTRKMFPFDDVIMHTVKP